MSPALNESSTLEHFEHSNASEIRNGIMFDFYPGLPQLLRTMVSALRHNYMPCLLYIRYESFPTTRESAEFNLYRHEY